MTARTIAAIVVIAGVAAPGCVADNPRRATQPQPAGIQPTEIQVFAPGRPEDSDVNGFLDSAPLTIYLWAPERFTQSIAVPGRFEFRLVSRDGAELRTWTFDEAATRDRLRRLQPGPGYVIRLSVLDAGSDRSLGIDPLLLHATFTPEGGKPIRSNPTPLVFGPVVR